MKILEGRRDSKLEQQLVDTGVCALCASLGDHTTRSLMMPRLVKEPETWQMVRPGDTLLVHQGYGVEPLSIPIEDVRRDWPLAIKVADEDSGYVPVSSWSDGGRIMILAQEPDWPEPLAQVIYGLRGFDAAKYGSLHVTRINRGSVNGTRGYVVYGIADTRTFDCMAAVETVVQWAQICAERLVEGGGPRNPKFPLSTSKAYIDESRVQWEINDEVINIPSDLQHLFDGLDKGNFA